MHSLFLGDQGKDKYMLDHEDAPFGLEMQAEPMQGKGDDSSGIFFLRWPHSSL